jgi:ADP-glucose pyrophosphorylase
MHSNTELISKTLTLIAPSDAADLSPLTRNKPQCLLPFGREFRVIDFTVSNC